MALNCGNFEQNILINCTTPLTPGVEDRLLLGLRRDLIDYEADTDGAVTALNLRAGSKMISVDGINGSIRPNQTSEQTDFFTYFNHAVQFIAVTDAQKVKNQIETMFKESVFAIIQNKNRTAEVYGIDVGLVGETLTNDKLAAGGGYDITLQTNTRQPNREPKLPRTLTVGTAWADTLAYLESLLTPAVAPGP